MNIVTAITEAIGRIASAAESYYEHRKEGWDIHLSKQARRAINFAEEGFDLVEELFFAIEKKSSKENKILIKRIKAKIKAFKKFN